ncbi:hypothetical protein ACDQ55_14160 [Chitinophaga sp. 30R24]|uniref:hypothetical protein n=1 Tax=Chitinophaga sp. 30R24 TaxID=3248838 RepID=UPI003B9061CC
MRLPLFKQYTGLAVNNMTPVVGGYWKITVVNIRSGTQYRCSTAIEIMPVAQFPGTRNWGYDGVYPRDSHCQTR